MNPLLQILQCLKRTTKSWHLIIEPDPRKYLAFERVRPAGVCEYRMKLLSNVDLDDVDLEEFLPDMPTIGGVSNSGNSSGPGTATKSLNPKWVRIIDTDRRNADGQNVRDVLIDTMNKFPTYDLQSQQGSEAAIRDIEQKLSSVASFKREIVRK